ncbi:fungal-specific transcription factor domain-containing protein, partial [Aspergillus unguis]
MSLAQQKRHEEPQNQQGFLPMSAPAPGQIPKAQPVVLTPPSPPKPEGTGTESDRENSPPGGSGKLLVKDTVTNYIDSAHWKAILEEINEFKESFQENDEASVEDATVEDDSASEEREPTIWFGMSKPMTKEDLLSDVPVRIVTDRLVSCFLTTKEPIVTILHVPTFQKEYQKFWANPQGVSLAWLGMLYAIMALSTMFYQKIKEPIHGPGDNYKEIAGAYRKRSAQCLVQSNYIAAGQYKVEALFLYTMVEFHRKHDVESGVPFLMSITIKLAMQMGYHRDPRQFPAISAFHGEMRRRTWVFLCQLDALISFEVGIPRTIQDWQYDTELPRNLMDEDFDENTRELPPSRPLSEITTSTYAIAKWRIMMSFGRILDIAFSRKPVTYEETLEVDRRLEEAHSLVPPAYRIRPINQSLADPPDLIFRRFSLATLYQKARCVLHRRYLGEVHTNQQYTYSREVCISAAKEILRDHADLYRELQPGGLMHKNRIFPSSIQYTDYLLAAMIVCMELSHNHAAGSTVTNTEDVAALIKDRTDLISTLENSHQILRDISRQSADAQKAHAALTVMLNRVKSGLHTIPPPKTSIPTMATTQQMPGLTDVPLPHNNWPNGEVSAFDDPLFEANQTNPLDAPYPSFDVIGDMLETPANLDWQLWDQQIQNQLNFVQDSNMWYGH